MVILEFVRFGESWFCNGHEFCNDELGPILRCFSSDDVMILKAEKHEFGNVLLDDYGVTVRDPVSRVFRVDNLLHFLLYLELSYGVWYVHQV